MRKTMKTLAAAMLAAALGALSANTASAQTADSFTLTVTIGGNLGVIVLKDDGTTNRDVYDFGSLNWGDVTVNTATEEATNDGRINIDNSSDNLQQDYQLSITNNSANLTLKTAAGSMAAENNSYRVSALFQDAQPAAGDFDTYDIITGAAQSAEASGASVFVKYGASAVEDGKEVDEDDRLTNYESRLWLMLELSGLGTFTGGESNFATVSVIAQ